MKLCKPTLMVTAVVGPLFLLVGALGCGGQQEIPLAKVEGALPQPAQDRSKLKTPPGVSPSVLPQ
ncbi:hypothetical protein [Paludisphaera rhizosphaerae]|uniref:hypothetical protein n=1 Tax=Paludisphaera rhizosphaerae TaxID=2711216 RepID=UPI0013EC3453|nr:hypothetical protein [Paludisphaera rhizosphaerae]